jgi:hypothetical protein
MKVVLNRLDGLYHVVNINEIWNDLDGLYHEMIRKKFGTGLMAFTM